MDRHTGGMPVLEYAPAGAYLRNGRAPGIAEEVVAVTWGTLPFCASPRTGATVNLLATVYVGFIPAGLLSNRAMKMPEIFRHAVHSF